jgi:hypothetical protein
MPADWNEWTDRVMQIAGSDGACDVSALLTALQNSPIARTVAEADGAPTAVELRRAFAELDALLTSVGTMTRR